MHKKYDKKIHKLNVVTYSIQVNSNALTTALIHLSNETLLLLSSVKNSDAIRKAVALVQINLDAFGIRSLKKLTKF